LDNFAGVNILKGKLFSVIILLHRIFRAQENKLYFWFH